MEAIEKFKLEKLRISSGTYKLKDYDYRRCDCCRGDLIYGCTYLIKNGLPAWICGFCERGLKNKDENMEYKIAIDADSLVNIALSRHPLEELGIDSNGKKMFNGELAYAEFCYEIGKIKGAVFLGLNDYEKGDSVKCKVILSARRNFRYDIYPDYKAKRPPRSEERIFLMKLIYDRLSSIVEIHKNVEADDVVIQYAKEGWYVAAIDKDVINACTTYCYNYKKYTWSEPRTEFAIEGWYLMQALMGDSTDNIKGAKGIGEKKAFAIVDEMEYKTFANIIEYFDSYEDALTSMRLVRMDQWNGKEVILWEPTTEEHLI